jgi:hypothetical protein
MKISHPIASEGPASKSDTRPGGLPVVAWILWSIPTAVYLVRPAPGPFLYPVVEYQFAFFFWVWIMLPFRLIAAHVCRSPRSTWVFYISLMPLLWPFMLYALPFVYRLLVPWLNPKLMNYPPFV